MPTAKSNEDNFLVDVLSSVITLAHVNIKIARTKWIDIEGVPVGIVHSLSI